MSMGHPSRTAVFALSTGCRADAAPLVPGLNAAADLHHGIVTEDGRELTSAISVEHHSA